MGTQKRLACVTGGTGMVGRHIIESLVAEGYSVRALTRTLKSSTDSVEYIIGDFSRLDVLEEFVSGADSVFHCAAELTETSSMEATNVDGTKVLLEACRSSNIKYFCFISSAGVVGLTTSKVVDEITLCNPQNEYENTKSRAEVVVSAGIPGVSIVILRPTNVIDSKKVGAFCLPIDGGWISRLKAFITGGEGAHLVHAQDVASAAMFFIAYEFETPECFFVSQDDDSLNTVAGVWEAYDAALNGRGTSTTPLHLPYWLPRYLRRILGRRSNSGDVRYSSRKLLNFGFEFTYDVRSMARDLVEKNV